jgi:hypothetical protein
MNPGLDDAAVPNPQRTRTGHYVTIKAALLTGSGVGGTTFVFHEDYVGCGSATDPGLCRFTRPA